MLHFSKETLHLVAVAIPISIVLLRVFAVSVWRNNRCTILSIDLGYERATFIALVRDNKTY